MSDQVFCARCKKDCTHHHWMCDRAISEWCDHCFALTACGSGKHGEGCPTQVFEDAKTDDTSVR